MVNNDLSLRPLRHPQTKEPLALEGLKRVGAVGFEPTLLAVFCPRIRRFGKPLYRILSRTGAHSLTQTDRFCQRAGYVIVCQGQRAFRLSRPVQPVCSELTHLSRGASAPVGVMTAEGVCYRKLSA